MFYGRNNKHFANDARCFFDAKNEVIKMTTLYLTTSDQHLIAAHKVKIASGDINSVQLCVTFDSLWDNYPARTAVFYTSNDDTRIEVLLIDDACVIPPEVLTESCILYVGIRGISMDGTKVKTSSLVQHKIVPGAGSGKTTIEPTMDLYQQYLKAMVEKVDPIYTEIKKDIEKEYEKITALFTPDELWKNPDHTVEYPGGTLSMDLTEYKRIKVIWKYAKSSTETCENDFTCKNEHGKLSCISTSDTAYARQSSRSIYFSDDEIIIGTGYFGSGISNNWCIPVKIVGYRY
jgi:hypothetical protein